MMLWMLMVSLTGCFLVDRDQQSSVDNTDMAKARKIAQNQPSRKPTEIKRKVWPSEQEAAPSRTLWGMDLGKTTHDETQAWLTERGLDCPVVPSPRRETIQFRCKSGLENSTFPERKLRGKVEHLLIAHTDDGPIHYVGLLRKYSDPNLAIADLDHTMASVEGRLGAPHQVLEQAPTPAHFKNDIAHFEMSWRYEDLRVTLTLYKLSGVDVNLREVWEIPGVERAVQARPGSKGHGGSDEEKPHSPHGLVE